MSREGKPVRGAWLELTPHYVEIRSPAAVWIVRRGCEDAVKRGDLDFLMQGGERRQPGAGGGRGPIVRFLLAGQPAVGKRALRGGFLGPVFGRLYLGKRRGLDQVRAAVRLGRAGVSTPVVLAFGSARAFGPLCAQVIVTRELQDAQNLFELAAGAPPLRRRRDIILLCADLVRRMHDTGFLHADLNVSNIVLERGPAGETLHVVDLDRGRFRQILSPRMRLCNLARLLRSYEKWIAGRLRLSRREEICFLQSYGGHDRALVRFLVRRLARYRSRLGPRRLRWRLTGASGSKDRLAGPLQ